MKKILVSQSISQSCKSFLEKAGFSVLLLPPFDRLSPPVSCHADMLVFKIGNTLILHNDYYKANKAIFDGLGKELELTHEIIGDKYPYDILLNAYLSSDGTLFSKTNFTSVCIKQKAGRLVNVNQGYVKCSTCEITDKAVITADASLCAAYEKHGIDVLKLIPGNIHLDGYDFGFIGGASCRTDDKTLLFFGRAELHPQYAEMAAFADKYGVKLVSASDEVLTDLGGAVIIE